MILLQLLLLCFAGWIHRHQQDLLEYLQEEIKVLREQLGRRPRFNDVQRRRLAAKAVRVGRPRLNLIVSLVTPKTLLLWHQRLIGRKYEAAGTEHRVDLAPPKRFGS